MPLNSWWNSGSHQLVLKSLLYSIHIHPPIFFIGQIHLNFVIISTKSLKKCDFLGISEKTFLLLWFQPCSARGCTCLWTFFNQILAKIFEWKLVVCQLKQKNLELSCLYMKGELLAIDKDSNKTYLCTVVPFNMARLYWIILKCYYLLSCTDGGYAKDYTLSVSQLTYMFFKYMQGFSLLLLLDWKYQFFFAMLYCMGLF